MPRPLPQEEREVRVTVDRDLCQGHGMCAVEAPTVFSLPKGEDQVELRRPRPGDDLLPQVRKAIAYCPTMALALEE